MLSISSPAGPVLSFRSVLFFFFAGDKCYKSTVLSSPNSLEKCLIPPLENIVVVEKLVTKLLTIFALASLVTTTKSLPEEILFH